MNGGTGTDTLDASNANTDLTIDLAAGTSTGQGTDTLSGVENATGGTGNDTLTGNSGDNVLNGGTGNDTLAGNAGNDFAFGNDGTDSLDGGAGNDRLASGAGAGTIDGGTDTNVCAANGDVTTLRCDLATTEEQIAGVAIFAGTIRDSGGNPVTGEQLGFFDMSLGVALSGAITDANGRFRTLMMRGSYQMGLDNTQNHTAGYITHYGLRTTTFTVASDMDLDLTIPYVNLDFTVVNPEGQPIEGVNVYCNGMTVAPFTIAPGIQVQGGQTFGCPGTRTDASGRTTIRTLPGSFTEAVRYFPLPGSEYAARGETLSAVTTNSTHTVTLYR